MKTYIVDRFEEDIAVLECDNETIKEVPRSLLPLKCKEGDVIKEDDTGTYMVDKEETKKRKKQNKDLMDSLFVD